MQSTRLFVVLSLLTFSVSAQTLSIDECYALSNANYPLIRQRNLLKESEGYSMDNIKKSLWPQLNFQAQATSQSEVTKINIHIPGVSIPSPSYNQYKATLDIAQPITDLFLAKSQKEVLKQNVQSQLSNNDVDLYKIRERINQLYLGTLMTDEQLRLNALVDKDLKDGRKRIEVAMLNGVDYKTSLDKIDAQLLQSKQRKLELQTTRSAYLDMMSRFINQPLNEATILSMPLASYVNDHITRPELSLFSAKTKVNELQEVNIRNRAIPKISLFAQLGLGRPNPLNFLNTTLSPYAIGGVRFNWNINSSLYNKNDIHLLRIESAGIQIQRDVFLFNLQQTLAQQNKEIEKLDQLLSTDDELITLRSSIKNTANVQLENGVISANDFIKEVNAEDQARQNKLLHQIQRLSAQYAIQYTTGQ